MKTAYLPIAPATRTTAVDAWFGVRLGSSARVVGPMRLRIRFCGV